jgi:Cdc6-like AAA superfamily ATPase
VTTIGQQDLTSAESWREDVVLKALQGGIKLNQHPFFCSIWAPSLAISWPPPPAWDGPTEPPVSFPLIYYPGGTLNASQDIAVQRIVSEADNDRVVLIHGPPGTGKTTVIAASVSSIMEYGNKQRTIWLVAHSNVAVKNIAEKLDKVGFREFKLLVSKDFYYDWCVALCSPSPSY